MGTQIQTYKLQEEDYRGEIDEFKACPKEMKNNNDLLNITRKELVSEIHEAYLQCKLKRGYCGVPFYHNCLRMIRSNKEDENRLRKVFQPDLKSQFSKLSVIDYMSKLKNWTYRYIDLIVKVKILYELYLLCLKSQ